MLFLEELNGQLPPYTHREGVLSIGRTQDNQISLSHNQFRMVSGHHLRIDQQDNRWSVTDLSSTNGTYVNGIRIAGSSRLRSGDILQVGSQGPRFKVQFKRDSGQDEHQPVNSDFPPPKSPPSSSLHAEPSTLPGDRTGTGRTVPEVDCLFHLELAGGRWKGTRCTLMRDAKQLLGTARISCLPFDPDVDITVAEHHATVMAGPQALEIIDEAGGGIYLDGKPVLRCQALGGETFTLGLNGPRIRVVAERKTHEQPPNRAMDALPKQPHPRNSSVAATGKISQCDWEAETRVSPLTIGDEPAPFRLANGAPSLSPITEEDTQAQSMEPFSTLEKTQTSGIPYASSSKLESLSRKSVDSFRGLHPREFNSPSSRLPPIDSRLASSTHASSQEESSQETGPQSPNNAAFQGYVWAQFFVLLALVILSAVLGVYLARYYTEMRAVARYDLTYNLSQPQVPVNFFQTEDVSHSEVERLFRRRLSVVMRELGVKNTAVPDAAIATMLGYLEHTHLRYSSNQVSVSPYLVEIVDVLRKKGLPASLQYLPWVESQYSENAVSSAEAKGLWQFIRSTAVNYGLTVTDGRDDRLDWRLETQAASQYLWDLFYKDWHDRWDPLLGIASYNLGEKTVVRKLNKLEGLDATDLGCPKGSSAFWQLRAADSLVAETAEYVPRFLAASVYFTFRHEFNPLMSSRS